MTSRFKAESLIESVANLSTRRAWVFHGFVVGVAGVFGEADLHGFIWKDSGPLVALDDLMVQGTTIKVVSGTNINERGEIAGTGLLPNGDLHAVLLLPCDDEHPHFSCQK